MSTELTKRILTSIVLVPLIIFLSIKGSLIFNIFLVICFLITSYEWYKMPKKIIIALTGNLFILFSFYSVYEIRNNFEGEYLYFFSILIICIASDIGGYFFGKIFKGPKIVKKISPNKTYSGVFGSYILSVLSIFIFFTQLTLTEKIYYTYEIFIFTLCVSTVSQLGDLCISYYKRSANIKDSGIIIPGHGGLLDRIDGMLFAFPFSFILITFNFFNFIK